MARWLASGLTEAQILSVARKSRERQAQAPQGPKALDGLMAAAASQPKAAQTTRPAAIVNFWAEKLRSEAYVAPSAISIAMANELIRSGLVSADRLRARGIAYSTPLIADGAAKREDQQKESVHV